MTSKTMGGKQSWERERREAITKSERGGMWKGKRRGNTKDRMAFTADRWETLKSQKIRIEYL